MKYLLILFLAPAFSYAGIDFCEPTARGRAQNLLEAYIYGAERNPRPENQIYLACRGQQLGLMNKEIRNDGGMYSYYRYDHGVMCGAQLVTFWAEYYERNNNCYWRGE